MIKRILFWGIGVILVVAVGLFFWQQNQSPKTQYSSETATLADIENTVIAGGQVYAEELIDVGAQATGRVDRLYVKLGQRLKKGDLIADIDATQQKNALKDEEVNHQVLLAQYDIKKIQLEQTQTEFNKQQKAYKAGLISKLDFLKAKTSLATAQKELSVNQSQLEQARLKIATAKTNLGYTRITAPIDGVVVSIVTKQGQNINAMQSSPTIIKLAQIDRVQIKAKFSEADIPKLKTGMKAHFHILGLPKQKFEATLDALELAPVSEPSATSTGAVYYYGLLSVPNPDHQLHIGMTANVTVQIEHKPNVLVVPITALGKQLSDDEYEVQIIDDENAKVPTITTRTIKTGISNKIHTEVISGLQAGEKVVISQSDGSIETLNVVGL